MLDPKNTPPDLRKLLPIAEKWDLEHESDRLAKLRRSSSQERSELCDAVDAHRNRIAEWLDSFGEDLLGEEASAFLYLTYAAAAARRTVDAPVAAPAALAFG